MSFHRLTTLPPGHIFVFGSNLRGVHGAGAARDAVTYFDADLGVGEGLTGRAYALPTKDASIRTLPIDRIAVYARRFMDFAASRPDLTFLLTPVGCGLAGYRAGQIAPLFLGAPGNVVIPAEFRPFIVATGCADPTRPPRT